MVRRRTSPTATSRVAATTYRFATAFWQVLPGEMFATVPPPATGPAFRTRRGGEEIADDAMVTVRVDPDLRVERGRAPLWRVKPGQVFMVVPSSRTTQINYCFLHKHAGAVIFNDHPVSLAVDQVVWIIPRHPRARPVPRESGDPLEHYCNLCRGTGWMLVDYFDDGGNIVGLTVASCPSCHLIEMRQAAANAARSCGLPVSHDYPYVVGGTEPVVEDYWIELRISRSYGETMTANGIEQIIRGSLTEACTVESLTVEPVPSQLPSQLSEPVLLPEPRTRVIDLNDGEEQLEIPDVPEASDSHETDGGT